MTLSRLTVALLASLVALPPASAQEPPPATPGLDPASAAAATTSTDGTTTPGAATPPSAEDPHAPISSDDERLHYAVALHGRYLSVPGFLLAPFLQQYTTLSSGEFGADFVRRKGSLDITVGMNMGFYSLPDGNFLGSSKDPMLDTHYVQFRGLDIVSLDVMFQYHHDLNKWLEIVVGGGVGLGVLMGDIYLVNNSDQRCNASNAGDPAKCHPIAASTDTYTNGQGMVVPVGEIKPGDPDFQKKLDATAASQAACIAANGPDCRDTAHHPHYHIADSKPPVVPMISFILGFRFKLERHWNLNVNAGFHDGLVIGGGPEYVF